jgi:hypothetical protein
VTLGRALAFTARQLVSGRRDTAAAVLRGAADSVMRRERKTGG